MTQLTGENTTALLARHGRPHAAAITLNDFCLLTKPRLTLMVVLTAYVGFAMGQAGAYSLSNSWTPLLAVLAGVTLSCMGASIWNQVYERDTDALMARTSNRPLAAHRLSVAAAAATGTALCAAGVLVLLLATNPLAAALELFTIVSYNLIYTPAKRLTTVSTIIGAVPGALPPVIGYTAATGRVDLEAWLLFAILFLWQLPHFLAIAWLYRDQYARAGIPLLPVIDRTGGSTSRQVLFSCVALVCTGLAPTLLGVCGVVYFWGALLAGVVFLAFSLVLVVGRRDHQARAVFLASLAYLPVVYALMLVDRT